MRVSLELSRSRRLVVSVDQKELFGRALGLERVGLLASPGTAPFAIAGVVVWKIAGYSMVLFLSGLQSIPTSVLEAAALDGAGAWQRLRRVVLPLLGPTSAFVGTTSLILTFQAFDVVRIMTQGGPVRSTTVFVYSVVEPLEARNEPEEQRR